MSNNGNENKKIVKLVSAYANFVYVQEENGDIFAETKDFVKEKYADAIFISASPVIENVKLVQKELKKLSNALVEKGDFVEASELEPMYLRKSQAEYQRDARKV